MAIQVYLADDHAILREGLHLILDVQPDIEIVGEATNGRDALNQVRSLHPDVVVMDIAMPELNGIETTRQIRETIPSTQIVILSMHSTSEHIYRALSAGALGYVLKESVGAELVDAIRAAYAGRRYLCSKLTAILPLEPRTTHLKGPLESLSAREREVLQLTVEGKSGVEIATILSL
ncbi:MAG TPA: response regulator transcription factor, partial [Aggregatilineales bacterium]|nr:response regulator transcription factor [Aggregatilineales bacterium]